MFKGAWVVFVNMCMGDDGWSSLLHMDINGKVSIMHSPSPKDPSWSNVLGNNSHHNG